MGYKYKVNHHYFDEVDTEYKAYMLGLIYADGSIIQPKGNRQLKLVISLQEEDGYILDKFSKEVCGGSKYLSHPPAIKNKGWKKRVIVNIVSDILCKKLISYGCGINKSRLGMQFPNINAKFHSHFVRGFLDGDGSVLVQPIKYSYKRKTVGIRKDTHIQRYKLRVAFSSTDLQFLQKIAEVLGIDNPYIASKIRKQLNYIFWIENRKQTISSLEYIYSESIYFLKRKYDKFLTFKETIKSQAEITISEGLETT